MKQQRKHNIKIDKIIRRFFLMLILAILVCLVCPSGAKMTAHANEQEQVFNIDAQLLPSGSATYDIMLTVENTGEDWEGTVRLMAGGAGSVKECAYDAALILPQGSTKQFAVRVPKESIYSANAEVQVILLDENSNVAADKVLKEPLKEYVYAVPMGILSDDYSALTYLDMGGAEIDFYSGKYPIRLMEINKDNLTDSLYSLAFLIIDGYNTDILTGVELLEIERWVGDGGVLIIGTGSYAGDTLRGFDCLEIECKKVYSPGENPHSYSSDYVDWAQLNMAELKYSESQYYDYEEDSSLALINLYGDGTVGVLPYALSELGGLDASDYNKYCTQSEFVYRILDDVSMKSTERYRTRLSVSNINGHYLQGILRTLGNSSVTLNFGVLKFIIIAYVIIAGPILYMILRSIKKRGLYWAAVSVTALVGVLLVFFAGRGFKVASTRVYSVTAYNLSGRGDCTTYLHCYDAGHREWSLRLAEGYEYAGPLSGGSFNNDDTYYYHIRKDGDGLFFGIKPSSGFEDSYFCAGRAVDVEEMDGSIDSTVLKDSLHSITGTVTNNTNYNFAYFAVVEDDYVQVYKSLRAGETNSLTGDEMIFSASWSGHKFYYDGYLRKAKKCVETGNLDAISALGVGISSAYQQMDTGETAIIGVVEDWDKAVDDNCSEVSYGCFYMIQ